VVCACCDERIRGNLFNSRVHRCGLIFTGAVLDSWPNSNCFRAPKPPSGVLKIAAAKTTFASAYDLDSPDEIQKG
jgi:hypothetical protein